MRKMSSFKCKETSKFILVALYWKYVHSSTRRKIKAGKKNLKVKIFNLQYDAMGYTTYSFYHLHKNVWKENFWYSGYMYITCPLLFEKIPMKYCFYPLSQTTYNFCRFMSCMGWSILFVCFLNHTHKIKRTRIIYLCIVEPWIKERLNLLLYKIYIMTMILP